MRRQARVGPPGCCRARFTAGARSRIAGSAPMAIALALASGGCERGCTREWLAERGLGAPTPTAPGPMPLGATDCPDGLARCEEGTVSASRLATLPSSRMPCPGPAAECVCPWDPVGECGAGCAADGAEIVVERGLAVAQLCAPAPDAGSFAMPVVPAATPPLATTPPPAGAAPAAARGEPDRPCEEGDRYRCSDGRVVECASGRALARCVRGCFSEGTSIDDDDVSREAAFAILCSR
jgi:hypothetical protein